VILLFIDYFYLCFMAGNDVITETLKDNKNDKSDNFSHGIAGAVGGIVVLVLVVPL